jgi:hypothetical protein
MSIASDRMLIWVVVAMSFSFFGVWGSVLEEAGKHRAAVSPGGGNLEERIDGLSVSLDDGAVVAWMAVRDDELRMVERRRCDADPHRSLFLPDQATVRR